MNIEKELKLIPQENILPEDLIELLKEHDYKIESNMKRKKQVDIYYDDELGNLNKNGDSFRIRITEDKVLVTYKTLVNSDKNYKERVELEEQIPKEYIKKDGTVDIDDAIKILTKKNPEIMLPKKLSKVVTIINRRDKLNMKDKYGSEIELAFDNLKVKDKNEVLYDIQNEIECEMLNGQEETLNNLYNIIKKNYNIKENKLSKYSRALTEIKKQKDDDKINDIVICAILSDMLKTNEFSQLKFKGQMIHDYRIPISDNLSLDNFKDFKYMIDRISKVRETKDYSPRNIENLEEMFLCFFSDMSYKDLENRLTKFLNKYYYNENAPITNRMLHSHQVMLITGLISRSNEIEEKDKKTLLCMTSALLHDIGHVPGAHPTEEVLKSIDGFFSHEQNGKNVVEKIISKDISKIQEEVYKYCENSEIQCDRQKIVECINKNKQSIKEAIGTHSRTNSEKRGDGTVVQLPREADKICYGVSDIVDVTKHLSRLHREDEVKFFPEVWKKDIIKKIGKGYEEKENYIRSKIEDIETKINTGNFGAIATNIASTVKENILDSKTYYDVEQDLWNILISMTKYVKDLRTQRVIDNKREKLQRASQYFVIEKFCENSREFRNKERAWEETVNFVTNSNDKDILDCIARLSETLKNDDEVKKAMIKQNYLYYIRNIKELESILNKSDKQIKLKTDGKFNFIDLLTTLNERYSFKNENFEDIYYKRGVSDESLCYRRDLEKNEGKLVLKRKKDKNVRQIERAKYEIKLNNGMSLEDGIKAFNEKYPEHELKSTDIECIECIINTNRVIAEGESGIHILNDKIEVTHGENGKKYDKPIKLPEIIEIKHKEKDKMKVVNEKLQMFCDTLGLKIEDIITKETKEQQALRETKKFEEEKELER